MFNSRNRVFNPYLIDTCPLIRGLNQHPLSWLNISFFETFIWPFCGQSFIKTDFLLFNVSWISDIYISIIMLMVSEKWLNYTQYLHVEFLEISRTISFLYNEWIVLRSYQHSFYTCWWCLRNDTSTSVFACGWFLKFDRHNHVFLRVNFWGMKRTIWSVLGRNKHSVWIDNSKEWQKKFLRIARHNNDLLCMLISEEWHENNVQFWGLINIRFMCW